MNITTLKGIGTKTAELFAKLGIYTTQDLLKFYPRDYDVYEEPILVDELTSDYEATVLAVYGIIARKIDVYDTGKLSIISTIVRDEKGEGIKCVWYNMPYLKSSLRQGMRYIFRGRVVIKNSQKILEQPQIYTVAQYNEIKGVMQPVYPLTKGLSNKTVTKAVKQAIELFDTNLEMEYIPKEIRIQNKLAEHNFAVVNIHFPKSMEDYIQARKRLAFEEFFIFVLAVRSLKTSNARRPNKHIILNDSRTDELIAKLPYKLTNAQYHTWLEIRENMASDKLMSRLIQGDVGSGKTIIAVLALLNTVYSGSQGALMAPTEVLAKQHFESITAMFEKYGIDMQISLLTGSMTASAKKKEYEKIAAGQTHIIIGTHALIQEKVVYKDLALVITDEQHRFGVNQRKDFSDKGKEPHVLVMSATPIPRTLAIIIYGDLDISIIDELPANRIPIKNCVVDTSYRPNAYEFIKKQVALGRQAYIICPMVEESESVEAENVVDYANQLRQEMPSEIIIEILHGKMKPTQKNDVMQRFSDGEIHILVSTTVVEVGVNVPNATVMMVENADRFGLAQLHQLRGRVGRGAHQSYCIFVAGNKSSKNMKRLEILNKTNDGFKIAEEDLKLRGPGDFFGVRQSGELDLGIADIYTDATMLKAAADAADKVMEKDMLAKPENAILAEKVHMYTIKCLEKINL
ncbi:MAG: ATP-dependent DNA helicase RecG [Lachnospira sp.]|nr:ATP-dependent DNA helicase RecG [Lachnospira sp.]